MLGALLGGQLALLIGCESSEPSPRLGRFLADSAFNDMDGKPRHFSEFAGSPLLINIWATWCPPCRAEMGSLDVLFRELGPRGLGVVGIATDTDRNLLREYLLRKPVAFPVWCDPGGQRSSALAGSPAIPATLLVSRDGIIRRVVFGEQDWSAGKARDWVGELLA